ncbi:hypothetical protein XANCAGTX0491_008078 [Xanthoria calcicola]
MSEEDDGDQLVTKPFKFVTAVYQSRGSVKYGSEEMDDLRTLGSQLASTAGFDARFPNQNQ